EQRGVEELQEHAWVLVVRLEVARERPAGRRRDERPLIEVEREVTSEKEEDSAHDQRDDGDDPPRVGHAHVPCRQGRGQRRAHGLRPRPSISFWAAPPGSRTTRPRRPGAGAGSAARQTRRTQQSRAATIAATPVGGPAKTATPRAPGS